MAKKRKIVIDQTIKEEPTADREDVNLPAKFQDLSWKDWALKEYARYWYIVLCFFVDVITTLEIARAVSPELAIIVPVLVLALAIFLEYLIYRHIWGRDGILRRE